MAVDARLLVPLLTAERLRSYLRVYNGDEEKALALYDWNAAASGAVLELTGMIEVLVRNAMDFQLTDWARQRGSDPWFDIVPLDKQGKSDLAKARDRATRGGKWKEVHGKVVAELSFGFWRYLATRRYLTTLWTPALYRAFPLGDQDITRRRKSVEEPLASLQLVRNRAAHHEPIHRRDLMRDYQSALRLSGFISPDAEDWVRSRARLVEVIQQKPK